MAVGRAAARTKKRVHWWCKHFAAPATKTVKVLFLLDLRSFLPTLPLVVSLSEKYLFERGI